MSKTLFNRNTFNAKNVSNSNDVQDIKIDTLKATNAVIQNLTNTELQTATTNIATNSDFIVSNAESIAVNNTNIATNTQKIQQISYDDTTNTTTIGGILSLGSITDVETEIGNKQDTITAGDGLRFSTLLGEGNTLNVLTADGIAISGDTLVFDGEDLADEANIITTGDIQGGNLKYAEDDGGLTVVRNDKDQINLKQAILTLGRIYLLTINKLFQQQVKRLPLELV